MMPTEQRDFCYQIIIPELVRVCKESENSYIYYNDKYCENVLNIEIKDGLQKFSYPKQMFEVEDTYWIRCHLLRRLKELYIIAEANKRIISPILLDFKVGREKKTDILVISILESVYRELIKNYG